MSDAWGRSGIDNHQLVGPIRRRTRRWVLLVNADGAILSLIFGALTFPAFQQTPQRLTIVVAVFALYLTVTFSIGVRIATRMAERTLGWIAEDRPPTDQERRAVLDWPLRLAGHLFSGWVGASVLFTILTLVLYSTAPLQALRIAATILLSGLSTCTLCFLLVERSLRPAVALALRGNPPVNRHMFGVAPRLVVLWALGSGVPLLGIFLAALAGTDIDRVNQIVLISLLAAVGIAAGSLTTIGAARSVADPIEEVRAGLRRVQRGELDQDVPVDDSGEIALLQAGFNEMVRGLREREQLRDVFGRHVGAEVAQQALERAAKLGGERRRISALFIDVIGSTGLAQQRPPEEVVSMLNAMFNAVVRCVTPEGGWINKFEGDAALCVFGAPRDQPDHAARALRAARSLHGELLALALEHPGLDAGIGVSSGDALAGNVGAEQRYEYTVIGDPVNEAARLSEQAKLRPERVLASAASVQSAGEEAGCWESRGEIPLRGRSQPTTFFAPVESVALADDEVQQPEAAAP